MQAPQLHLASSSPRRHEILTALGLSFTAGGVDVDEQRLPGEAPDTMVLRLAALKARSAQADCPVVLGADTAVVLGDQVFGKPLDEADALAMLAQLSGQQHKVMTGVAVLAGGGVERSGPREAARHAVALLMNDAEVDAGVGAASLAGVIVEAPRSGAPALRSARESCIDSTSKPKCSANF